MATDPSIIANSKLVNIVAPQDQPVAPQQDPTLKGWLGQAGLGDIGNLGVIRAPDVNARQATATTAATTPWNVDTNQTVEGRIGGLLSRENPLMQAARTGAQQEANRRGLLNSSMAATGGELAMIQSALPIAQQDASTFANAGQFNAQAENTSSQFNANLQTGVSQSNAALGTQTDVSNQQARNAAASFNAEQNMKMFGMYADEKTKMGLANIEASYKTLMQANASAGEMFQQTAKNITEIMLNPDLDEESKNVAKQMQLDMLESSLSSFGKINNLDFGNLLIFDDSYAPAGTASGGTEKANKPLQGSTTYQDYQKYANAGGGLDYNEWVSQGRPSFTGALGT